MAGSSYKHSAAHPGFKAVEKKIGREKGIRNPGAVLAAAARKASPASKKRNPRLERVGGLIGHAMKAHHAMRGASKGGKR